MTAVGATSSGSLETYPTGAQQPGVITVHFQAGQARANNSLLTLGVGGEVSVHTALSAAGTVHFVLDSAGYFR